MWYLELSGELTDINIVSVNSSDDILSDLESTLDTEYPNDFPYSCYDVEVLSRTDNIIEINIIHESEFSNHMEKTSTTIRKT